MTRDTDTMIGASAQRLFEGNVDRALRERVEAGEFPGTLWQLAIDNGFAHALCPESAGGIGASWHDVWPILRGIGYWQVPLPLAETMIATMLLSLAGIEPPSGPIALIDADLPAVNDGPPTTRPTIIGPAAIGATDVSAAATGPTIVKQVAWARHCPCLVATSARGELLLIEAGTARIAIDAATDHAGIASDTLRFDGPIPITARAPNPLPGLARPIRALGALARSAMMVGALERVLDESVRYANDRVQFGKPIGKNQVIQQSLAVLAGDVCSARVAGLVAAIDAPHCEARKTPSAAFSIAVAKIRCGEAASRATSIAHQVHGAIGFTREHSLHFATRRLWAWRAQFGADGWWAEQLGREAIAAGSAGFWPAMTAKRFADA